MTRELCAIDGCMNIAKGRHRETRQRVCFRHQIGPCSIDGCSTLGMGYDSLTREPRCTKHFYGVCAADGCENYASGFYSKTRTPACRVHQTRGLGYVVPRHGEIRNRPTDVYLIVFPGNRLKVGITSVNDRPELIAKRNGGVVTRLGTWPNAREAEQVEMALLRALDALGMELVDPTNIAEPKLDGATEWREAVDSLHLADAITAVRKLG